MNSATIELLVIGFAMTLFAIVCVIAVWAFVRQYRREHPKGGGNDGQPHA